MQLARTNVAALMFSCLCMTAPAGCSAAQSDADAGGQATGSAGVLHYSGVVNGQAEFPTSDCGIIDGRLITFNAPHMDESEAEPAGAYISVTSRKAGYVVNFSSDNANATTNNSFIRMNLKQGISMSRKNGAWQVTFNGMRLYSINVAHQRAVDLAGTLSCTNIM